MRAATPARLFQLVPLVLAFAPGFFTAASAADTSASSPPPAAIVAIDLAPLDTRTDALLARADLTAYRGWLKYLRFVAHDVAARKGAGTEPARAAAARLDEWLTKITANPAVLATLRGVQEWAYESPVDDSGQPFKLVIPDDYNPAYPAPLSLYLHGATGNHLDHSSYFHAHAGHFDLAVLGRSRIGGYTNLSEADVLQVLAYVRAHWSIDPARLHLSGGSMGGMGTFRLGARYPHLWASGAVTCGAGDQVPAANLLQLPLYVIHSIDDPVVPILESRAVVQQLQTLGGEIIRDETNGLGHASWNYREGQDRANAWAPRQVRPAPTAVRRIDFTATDGVAARGWWAAIAEWGDAASPARIVANAGSDNSLYVSFTNLKAATFHLRESPFDPAQPLKISIDASVPFVVPAPLPAEITVRQDDAPRSSAWTFAAGRPSAPIRLHTPGGPSLLYDGEPLLIVYGTGGDDAHRAALKAAALDAARSPGPFWPEPVPRADANDADGIPQIENLYGSLATKADRDVTPDDLARCHLVLIGTADDNRIVAQLAPKLPVSLTPDAVVCNDGERFTGEHLALGLVHYNPLAPQRLVFWVAAHDIAAYAPGAIIPLTMAGRGNQMFGIHFGADLLVSRAGEPAQDIVATRAFTSRWQWTARRAQSPLLPERAATYAGFYASLADALRRSAQTDLGLVALTDRPAPAPLNELPPRHAALFAPGVSRLADAQALFPFHRLGVFEITGADLKAALVKASAKNPAFAVAGPPADQLEPARTYTVALPTESIWAWNSLTLHVPAVYHQTEVTVARALLDLR